MSRGDRSTFAHGPEREPKGEGSAFAVILRDQFMPSKLRKPKKKFRAATEARRQARALIGSPPPTRVEKDRRRKPPKHKKRLIEESNGVA